MLAAFHILLFRLNWFSYSRDVAEPVAGVPDDSSSCVSDVYSGLTIIWPLLIMPASINLERR